ncbi:macro domain-containing protein [Paenisporosarcina cavernae]|uniref:RNase III inhibitor n=1 Tax=Paenisporosarcina cavernae TaxID=2320858 RepID=A0A385YPU7_9BACL|nr:macro domain-containing protein [Paenisporosarcina cavernae]AYC28534.1 RNase III inhibitor [Paenisporosarcina cavernae]
MPYVLVRDDITKMNVDFIVNPSNTLLEKGAGTSGMIFDAAGETDLETVCISLRPVPLTQAVHTPAFDLPSRHILHVAVPTFGFHLQSDRALLMETYNHALMLADKLNARTIAFPLLGSGANGYPKEMAFDIANKAITAYLQRHDITVYLVLFDQEAVEVSRKIKASVQHFIDQHYVDQAEKHYKRRNRRLDIQMAPRVVEEGQFEFEVNEMRSLDDVLLELEESFSERLLRFIDQKGMTDVDAYKGANIDRRLFSKIRTNKEYQPQKKTVFAFAISLRLNLDEAKDLLQAAGYSLSRSSKFDVIMEYFLVNEVYDLMEVNETLFAFDQPILGA